MTDSARSFHLIIATAVWLVACKPPNPPPNPDAGAPSFPTITPANPTVLTCSTTLFEAVYTDDEVRAACPPGLACQVDSISFAASAGTIVHTPAPANITGDFAYATFTASRTTAGSPVTITAKALGKPGKVGPDVESLVLGTGSTTVTVIDPAPQAGTNPLPPTSGASANYPNLYTHAMSSYGNTVYAALGTGPADAATINVWRSDDGGHTWNLAGHAPPINLPGAIGNIAIAADAGDPMTVYVAFAIVPNGQPATLGFMVSTDQGATFNFAPLETGGSQGLDIISPASGTVVVLNTSGAFSTYNIFETWTDTTKGAALIAGSLTVAPTCAEPGGVSEQGCCGVNESPGQCQLTGYRNYSLRTEDGAYRLDGHGGPYENPKLFTDGNRALCVAYTVSKDGGRTREPVAQCSSDLANTWAPQIHFTKPLPATDGDIGNPVGTITPPGSPQVVLALTWITIPPNGTGAAVNVATVQTHPGAPTTVTPINNIVATGATLKFPMGDQGVAPTGSSAVLYDTSGVLWLTYDVADSNGHYRIAVDRSCDNGVTWSGGQSVGDADVAANPGLAPLSGTMGIFAHWLNPMPGTTGAVGDVFYRLSP